MFARIPMQKLDKANLWSTLVLLFGAVLLIGLLGRVAWLQTHVTQADISNLRSQHDVGVNLMARRASIYTADSTLVAGSVRVYGMFADPGFIFDPNGNLSALSGSEIVHARHIMARHVGKLLDMRPTALLNWMRGQLYYPTAPVTTTRATTSSPVAQKPVLRRFLWLKRDVGHEFYDRFERMRKRLMEKSRLLHREHKFRLAAEYFHAMDGVGFKRSTRRVYPLGTFAGQVIGFANSHEGLDGLESQLNSLLEGRKGRVIYVKDAADRALWVDNRGYRQPDDGMKVWLTLNTMIQGVAEEQLDKACKKFSARSGVAVVMNPRNGTILAMANYPTMDPNDYQKTPPQFRRNRAVTDPFEPGSVFKPFNLSFALYDHVVTLQTPFNCHHGRYRDPTGRLIKDVGGWGYLSVEDILVHSSNIGMTQIGWKMGIRRLCDGINAFGFGHMTGCILPGESPGIVRPLSQWTKGTLTSASFGYGVGVTPLQLARGLCAIANGGYLLTPQIIKMVQTRGGRLETWAQIDGPQKTQRIVPRWVTRQVITAMEQVMVRGTGQYAISPLYRLFGKTGTANLAVAGQDRYHAHQYNATFIAGGPVPDPRLICVVTVHEPDPRKGHYGGTVAGPACSRILTSALQYLQVPPDQGPATDPWWGKENELQRLKGLSH